MPLDPAKVRSARESAGLSQSEAARRAGIHRPNYMQIERGERSNPTLDTALAVARGLGVPLEKLLKL